MANRADPPPFVTRAMALALIAALALTFLRSTMVAPGVADLMVTADNDSIMRLLSVRDWLQGQGWFDMSNDRVLPPEGLSLHWSRYIDLGIAGVIWALSRVLPPDQAEAMALLVWPGLLLLCLMMLTLVTARRLFGPVAAATAVIAVALWRVTALNYFGPMVLDHHGVQILLLTVVVFTLVIDGPEVRRGIVGGAAAALALAVGLENLLPILVAGVILTGLAVATGDRGCRQLQVFGTALAVGAGILFIGQTPRDEWMLAQCDELSPPFLGLLGVAALAALTIGAVAPQVSTLRLRAALSGSVAIAAALVAVQIMTLCPNFPYGNLPDDIRGMINAWIQEARPASTFIATAHPLAFSHVLPTVAAPLAAAIIGAWRWKTGTDTVAERQALPILLIFAGIGAIGMFAQIRLVVLSAPVVPLLIGYAVAALADMRGRVARPALVSLSIVAVVATSVVPAQLHLAVSTISAARAFGDDRGTAGRAGAIPCRRPDVIRSLDALPPGRVLAPLSLGPPILLATDHVMVSAPYHRSAEALGNGLFAFYGDADAFLDTVDRARPDYIVMCSGGQYGDEATFVNAFGRGDRIDGFAPVAAAHTALIVLEVTR